MDPKDYLRYEPETGKIYWTDKPSKFSPIIVGSEAGTPHSGGYRQIKFGASRFLSHRLAWYLYYGEWPHDEIDHINGVKNDNKISNLRVANGSQNRCNCRSRKGSSSRFKGVSWSDYLKKWKVYIQKDKKLTYVGGFYSEEEAARAYDKVARELHGEYARLNFEDPS